MRDGAEDVRCTGAAAAVVVVVGVVLPGTAAVAAYAADGDADWAFAADHGGRAFARDGEDHRGPRRQQRGDGAVLGNIAVAAAGGGRFAVACGSCF